MRFVYWASMGLVAVFFLAGCGNFWQAPSSSSSGCTSNCTTLSSGFFYVLDQATNQIISYQISSGSLTAVGSPLTVPASPLAMTVAPNNDFLYVSTLSGIFAYSISSGALTLENSSQAIVSDPAAAMVIDSTDSWLIESSGSTGFLYAVPIDSTTGLQNTSAANCTKTSPICQVTLTGASINQIAISPNNDYVFVAAGTNGTQAFTFTAGNADPFGAAATSGFNPVNATSGAALSVAVDPSNRLLYVGEAAVFTSGGGLRVFTIASGGALKEISGSPYSSGGSGPHAILPKSTADYVYVANWQGTSSGTINGFAINDTNGTFSLTSTSSTATTVVEPRGLVEDSEDNFVIAVGAASSPYLDAYTFDTTTASKLDFALSSSSYAGFAVAANQP